MKIKKELRELAKSFLMFQSGVIVGGALRAWWGPEIALTMIAGLATAWLAFKYWKESKRDEN